MARRRWGLLAGLLLPAVVLADAGTSAGASTGTGGGASAPGPLADAQAEHRQQRARCQALLVAAVRTECLRQADRDLARRLATAQPARPATSAASAASATPPPAAGRR